MLQQKLYLEIILLLFFSGTITSDSKDKKKRPKAGATISMKRGPDARAPSNMTNRPRAGSKLYYHLI